MQNYRVKSIVLHFTYTMKEKDTKSKFYLEYEEKVNILERLNKIKELLPKDKPLTPKERRAISSIGNIRSRSIERLLNAWKTDNKSLPCELKMEELDLLYIDTQIYKELLSEIDSIRVVINDLYLQQGSKTKKLSNSVKKKIEGYQALYGGMERYISAL